MMITAAIRLSELWASQSPSTASAERRTWSQNRLLKVVLKNRFMNMMMNVWAANTMMKMPPGMVQRTTCLALSSTAYPSARCRSAPRPVA